MHRVKKAFVKISCLKSRLINRKIIINISQIKYAKWQSSPFVTPFFCMISRKKRNRISRGAF